MLGNGHVRFGRRAAETDQSKDRHRAAARPHTYLGDLVHPWDAPAPKGGSVAVAASLGSRR